MYVSMFLSVFLQKKMWAPWKVGSLFPALLLVYRTVFEKYLELKKYL